MLIISRKGPCVFLGAEKRKLRFFFASCKTQKKRNTEGGLQKSKIEWVCVFFPGVVKTYQKGNTILKTCKNAFFCEKEFNNDRLFINSCII